MAIVAVFGPAYVPVIEVIVPSTSAPPPDGTRPIWPAGAVQDRKFPLADTATSAIVIAVPEVVTAAPSTVNVSVGDDPTGKLFPPPP